MDELGLTLENRMQYTSNGRMRLKDICMIGLQMIDIVKNLH